MAIIDEQQRVVAKLEEVLNFFRGTQIKIPETLVIINEQVDTLLSSLKYLPTEPSFDSLPKEIKTDILSYLCDSGAFVAASVSLEWKQILQRKLKQVDEVNIGKHCINCEDNACFMPEEMLKASITHNLDVPLDVCHPLQGVDNKLVVEGLTSVSNLSIDDNCDDCNWKDGEHTPSLLPHQVKDLFEELEKRGKIMENLKLTDMDLNELDQNKLINDLLSKVKKLTLDYVMPNFSHANAETMLDNELFLRTLSQDSQDNKLTHLTLPNFDFPADMSIDFADAVSKVQNLNLGILDLEQAGEIATRLVQNIQARNNRMKTLILEELIDWRDIISPEGLKKILNKMDGLKLVGNFTPAQVEAAKSIPGIEADFNMISKGSI